ncbi:MAG: nucleotidyltransferase family protein [Oscillospiraceae bacterium]|nr:nucleotidyltransferase family protein [Oscillospiraceae bacterium]
MFEQLQNDQVQLMLALSKENIDNGQALKEKLSQTDMQAFFDLCKEHELDGVVASHIMELGLLELPAYWMEAYNKEKAHLGFLKDKAAEICRVMDENGITMVVLKNGGIMSDMVADPAACPMEDIDSLVKKSDFKKAHQILMDHGFFFKFRSEFEEEDLESAFRDGSTEYRIETPAGEDMWFELAWRAVAGRWIRRDLEPDADALIAQSYFAPGTKVGILSPEDNLLQVSVHTAKHSYVRAPGLRLHLDVERIVAHKQINWDLFLKKVEAAHVKTSTYYSLYLAKMLFNTPIPANVLDALYPGKRKNKRILKLISKAGLLHPGKPKFSKLQFLRFQTSLYDSKKDAWFVLCPPNGGLREIYGYKNPLLTPYYLILRGLDLVGIRKKKK